MASRQSRANGFCLSLIHLGLALSMLVGPVVPVSADDTPLLIALEHGRDPVQTNDDPLYTQHLAKLTANGGPGDWFGQAVAVRNDVVVVASPYDDELAQDAGAAYVFARNQDGADAWGLVKKLTADDGEADDRFSYNAVAIDETGSTLVVGASYDDEAGIDGGAAFVFERNMGGADNWGQVKKIVSPVTGSGRAFGYSLALSGDTLVIGEPGYNSDSGRVYIFGRNQDGVDNWGLVTSHIAPSPVAGDQYGFSVAICGDTMAVGKIRPWAPGTDRGTVYVYERNQGGIDNWGLVETLVAADGDEGDRFGWSIAIDDDHLFAGAYGDDDQGFSSGSVYVFERNQGGADNWGQVQKLTADDAQENSFFGFALAVDGDALIVGAYGDDDYGNASGAAYVFERNQGGADNWGQVQKLVAIDAAAEDRFGQGIGISGNIVARWSRCLGPGQKTDRCRWRKRGFLWLFHRYRS